MRFLVTNPVRSVGVEHPVVAVFHNLNAKADASVYDKPIESLMSRIAEIREKAITCPIVQGYRTLYANLGYPDITTAGERLLRVFSEKGFKRFGPLVDAYNLVALENTEGLGCHDVSELPQETDLVLHRASGSEKIYTFKKKKGEFIERGDLTYGFYQNNIFIPFAWLGKKDEDNTKFQLKESTHSILFTAIGNCATDEEYNVKVCHEVFENLQLSCPDVEMELLVGQFIESDQETSGASASGSHEQSTR